MHNTNQPASAAQIDARFQPEFVPLKTSGGDPVTGLSRSYWYDCEARGLIRLVRLRKPGQVKCRVLLPVADAVALIRRLGREHTTGVAASTNSGGGVH